MILLKTEMLGDFAQRQEVLGRVFSLFDEEDTAELEASRDDPDTLL
jgi:hypothetical protein